MSSSTCCLLAAFLWKYRVDVSNCNWICLTTHTPVIWNLRYGVITILISTKTSSHRYGACNKNLWNAGRRSWRSSTYWPQDTNWATNIMMVISFWIVYIYIYHLDSGEMSKKLLNQKKKTHIQFNIYFKNYPNISKHICSRFLVPPGWEVVVCAVCSWYPIPVVWVGVGRGLHMLYGKIIIAGASKQAVHRFYMVVCM